MIVTVLLVDGSFSVSTASSRGNETKPCLGNCHSGVRASMQHARVRKQHARVRVLQDATPLCDTERCTSTCADQSNPAPHGRMCRPPVPSQAPLGSPCGSSPEHIASRMQAVSSRSGDDMWEVGRPSPCPPCGSSPAHTGMACGRQVISGIHARDLPAHPSVYPALMGTNAHPQTTSIHQSFYNPWEIP